MSKKVKDVHSSEPSNTRRRWTDEENLLILDFLLDIIRQGKVLEKPNAVTFYTKAQAKLKLDDCSPNQLKNQVKNLRVKYTKAIEWRNQTGQGVLATDGEETFKQVLLKRCPHFDILDEIYGTKLSIDPPFIHDDEAPSTSEESVQQENSSDCSKTKRTETTQDSPYDETMPLTSKTAVKRRREDTSEMNMLAQTAKMRFELLKEELELSKQKWDVEKKRQEIEMSLSEEKFKFEVTLAERKMKLEEEKMKMDFEIAKFKIEQEMKSKIELAKLNIN